MTKVFKIAVKLIKLAIKLYPVVSQALKTKRERGRPMKAKIMEIVLKRALMPLITMLLGFAQQVGDYFVKGEELSAFWKKVVIAADFLGHLFRAETVESTDTPIDDEALDNAHALFQDTADEGNFILVTDFPIPKDNDDEPIDG
jgi:hypothetical protein